MANVLSLGGFGSTDITDVSKYPTVQAAIDSIATNKVGRLYFPIARGPYVPPSAAGWTLNTSCEVFSDGPGATDLDLIFRPYNSGSHKNSVIFTIAVNNVYMHDFMMYGATISDTDGTGDFIRIDNNTTARGGIIIERAYIQGAGRSGIRSNGTNPIDKMSIKDVTIYGSRGLGLYLYYMSSGVLSNLWCSNGRLGGIMLEHSGTNALIACATGDNLSGSSSTTTEADIVLKDCAATAVIGVNTENFTTYTCKNGLLLSNCRGCFVGGNEFDNAVGASNVGSRGIYLRDGSYGNTIASNNFAYVAKTVEIASAAADIGNAVMAQSVYTSDANAPGQMILPAGHRCFAMVNNLTAGVADNKGVGIMLPCMSAEADIDSSVLLEGLLFYDITSHSVKIRKAASTTVVP